MNVQNRIRLLTDQNRAAGMSLDDAIVAATATVKAELGAKPTEHVVRAREQTAATQLRTTRELLSKSGMPLDEAVVCATDITRSTLATATARRSAEAQSPRRPLTPAERNTLEADTRGIISVLTRGGMPAAEAAIKGAEMAARHFAEQRVHAA